MKASDVDKNSPVPIYYQIKELFKERIEGGDLEPHQRLPSERDLEKKYGISRMTARRALTELESEGYAYREQGKGSYVAEPKLRQALLELTGFTEDMKRRRMSPGARVIEQKLVDGDQELAAKLEVEVESKIFVLQRIRLAEEEPLAIETSHLRYEVCEGIEEYDFEDRSLYDTLKNDFDISLSWAEQSVEATLADEFEAENLGIDKGTPMLMTERTTYLGDEETPIEYARSVYRGDRYKLFVELRS
ncbi:GntR family transcriptional regulator [Candidatus Bipolaricaulota bacterium]|nr:GntR family transcriptional regulator [Candidatus Bipolaricaulota bacterium]MBS3825081.1 GntR family transcriptional regulator [Candidatus Bipolaricaulota bacterium]